MQQQEAILKSNNKLSNPNKKKQKAFASNQQQELVNTAMMSSNRGDDQSLLMLEGTTKQQPQENVRSTAPLQSSNIAPTINTMMGSRGSCSSMATTIPSIDILKDYNHDKVIALLQQFVLQPDEIEMAFQKKESITTTGDYPSKALDGKHLLNAIEAYNRVYNTPKDKVKAKKAIIDNLMEDGKITNKGVAESVANWLVKIYITQVAENKLLEREFNLILSNPNLQFYEVYTQCYIKIDKIKQIPSIPFEFTNYDALVSKYCEESDIVTLELSDGEQYLHEYNLKKLPFTNEGQLRRYILPWIPSLQIPINNQDTKLSRVNCAIAPSGMGKTAFIARCMTTIPGILITGSTIDDTGETTDRSVAHLHGCLESIKHQGEKYAIVRQVIHVLLISHLIHIIKAIKNVEQNPLILQPFDNNLNAYIGYIQCNENTEQISKTFDKIFNWAYFNICDVRNLTDSLIRKVCKLTKSKRFIFCVDEAHVFDKYFGKYKSENGDDRGLLSVIYSEISMLMSDIYYSNPYVIYAGSNFSIEVNNNYSIQSSIGKTSLFGEIQYLMNFDYFDVDGFISFLKLHINLPKQDEDDIRQHWTNRFPIRRKVAGLMLEQMVNYSEDVLEQSFNRALEIMVGEIKKAIENDCSPTK